MLKAMLDTCWIGRGSATIPLIGVKEVLLGVEAGEIVLIDVREPDEWINTGSPKGSIRVPLQSPDFLDQVHSRTNYRKELPIALCCRSGIRGKKAAELLVQSGFENVSNVEGGMKEWISENLPIEHGTE